MEATRDLVLLLTVDTLRPDYLELHGYDRESSPFLSEWMSGGLVFERALTPIARTTPALASLMTGEYPHTHGLRTLIQSLDASQRTIAEAASEAGYTTLAVVSNHLLAPARGLARGFDHYDFAGDRRGASETTRAALALLRAQPADAKIFLWVHYIDPHVPYAAPPEYIRLLDPGYEGRYPQRFGIGGIGDRAYPSDLGKLRAVFRNDLPAEVNDHVRRLYAADIRYTDDSLRELLRGIEAQRGRGWTVVFGSDHGEALGEHPFYFYDHGDYVYQAGLAVPLAIVLPEGDPLRRAERSRLLVSLIDVAPTLAELMELPWQTRGRHAGRSLVPLLRDEDLEPVPLFAESGQSFFPQELRRRVDFSSAGRFRAVVDGSWKLIYTPGLDPYHAYELYDLENDPWEQHDRYQPDHPEAKRLQAALEDWLTMGAEADQVPDAEDLERLRSLGYVE